MSLFDDPRFNALLFFPRRDTSPAPAGARDLRVSVAPDVHLHVRVHATAGRRALVLLFHGNGEVVADYDDVAPLFAEHADAALAVADFRGYGASSGTPTLRDAIADAHPVLDAVRAATDRPIVVMGRSLGGACAAELCRAPAPRVQGYAFESAAADLAGVARRRGIAAHIVLTDADRAVFDPLPKLRACTTPSLVLHGERDTLIEPVEARLTHDALGTARKRLVLVPGRGHNDVSLHPAYWRALRELVRDVTSESEEEG